MKLIRAIPKGIEVTRWICEWLHLGGRCFQRRLDGGHLLCRQLQRFSNVLLQQGTPAETLQAFPFESCLLLGRQQVGKLFLRFCVVSNNKFPQLLQLFGFGLCARLLILIELGQKNFVKVL